MWKPLPAALSASVFPSSQSTVARDQSMSSRLEIGGQRGRDTSTSSSTLEPPFALPESPSRQGRYTPRNRTPSASPTRSSRSRLNLSSAAVNDESSTDFGIQSTDKAGNAPRVPSRSRNDGGRSNILGRGLGLGHPSLPPLPPSPEKPSSLQSHSQDQNAPLIPTSPSKHKSHSSFVIVHPQTAPANTSSFADPSYIAIPTPPPATSPTKLRPSNSDPTSLSTEKSRDGASIIRTTEQKKALLGEWLGNVDALVEGVQRAGVWGL